jgi:RNA polymerase sigma-70 factor (ECF subfamily)
MDPEIHNREPKESVSELLRELNLGNRNVESRLMTIVYGELHQIAVRYMARERDKNTLQPTALVNEAYLRLVQQQQVAWQGRAHFLAVAAQVMRHILVDKARARKAGKRGGIQHQITLDDAVAVAGSRSIDLMALDEALTRLAALDERQSRIVELRFFGGLSIEEVALVLGISERTAKRDWTMARAWLHQELTRKAGPGRHKNDVA